MAKLVLEHAKGVTVTFTKEQSVLIARAVNRLFAMVEEHALACDPYQQDTNLPNINSWNEMCKQLEQVIIETDTFLGE